MSMLEQMVATRVWKEVRRFTEISQYRWCKEQRETVQNLLAEFKMLASSEYLRRHSRAFMVMAVAWAKEQIRSECEIVSRKVEKGKCFRVLSSKPSMGI